MDPCSRHQRSRRRGLAVLAAALLGTPLLLGGAAGAQEAPATPPARAAHVHEGTCDALTGPEFVERLAAVEAPAGEALGEDAAVEAAAAAPVAVSFTTLGVPLTDLLEEPHAIDVHASTREEDLGRFVACGEIAGVVGPDGGIAVALRSRGGSAVAGIGFLVPNPTNRARTNVSLLIADGLGAPAEGGRATEEAGTEEGAATEEAGTEEEG